MDEVRLIREVDPAAEVIGRLLADVLDLNDEETKLLAMAARACRRAARERCWLASRSMPG